MRRLYTLLAAILLIVPAAAQSQEKKTDVTGKWLFTVTSELGTGTPTVTFKQAGDSLTGHYSSATFGEVDFKGTFKDQKLNFSMKVDAGGQALTVTYSGQMDGENAMKGSVDFGGMGAGTFTESVNHNAGHPERSEGSAARNSTTDALRRTRATVSTSPPRAAVAPT